MKLTTNRFYAKYPTLTVCCLLVYPAGCRKPDPVPVIVPSPTTTVSPTLVSAQPTAPDQAEIIVKTGFAFSPADWQLSLFDAGGRPLPLTAAGSGTTPGLFNLAIYRAAGLTARQTYRLRFATRNAGGDSIRVERTYAHRTTGPRWLRLAHAPVVRGDFTGSVLNTDNLPGLTENRTVSIWRYQDERNWQTLSYFISQDQWLSAENVTLSLRHNLVRFQLQEPDGKFLRSFAGLGFVTSELQPGRRIYQKDLSDGKPVVPYYAGPDGEVRLLTTLDRAYLLTEGASQVWVRRADRAQYRAPDLPEPTGTLAVFRVGTVGYVVNQRPGLPPHLWAFDTRTETWTRRTDFPGAIRQRGVGFTVADTGFFGLGITATEETLRDLWQYNPATNAWQYATDYPGQGSTYLTVGQTPDRTFLGWGYEQQPTATGGIRLVGCTDFWEIKL